MDHGREFTFARAARHLSPDQEDQECHQVLTELGVEIVYLGPQFFDCYVTNDEEIAKDHGFFRVPPCGEDAG